MSKTETHSTMAAIMIERSAPRQNKAFPVNVNSTRKTGIAGMTSNVSETGVLFHTNKKFTPGERLVLSFADIGYPADPPQVRGVVVRSGKETSGSVVLPYYCAVHLDIPVPALAPKNS